AGAVGSLMVQLCHHLGAEVSASCRFDNCDYVAGLGATRAFAYDRSQQLDQVRAQDVVFDLIGGATHALSYSMLRKGGRLVCLTAAPFVDRGDAFGVLVTRAQIADSPRVLAAVAKLAAQGILQPRVAGVFPLAETALAHAALEQGRVTRGRLVIDIGEMI
ncbi:MAG: zinc-binding dehydrogenase, partial [Rhodoferax sp.]|nr:zinc-binding dehydrogenase [Rhodoferax sp.]